jgi:hypothetical protein
MSADHPMPFFAAEKSRVFRRQSLIIKEGRPLAVRTLMLDNSLQHPGGFLESHEKNEQDLGPHPGRLPMGVRECNRTAVCYKQLALHVIRNAHFHSVMGQETVSYLTNLTIGVILAGLMTHYWVRHGRSQVMKCWMLSAWVMTFADILFAVRPELPHWVAKLAPTLLVTVGQAGLFLSARVTSRQSKPWMVVAGVCAIHGAVLLLILFNDNWTGWRMIGNGLVWSGLSLASFLALRRGPSLYWQPIVSPANVFLMHGVFHGLRMGLALGYVVKGLEVAPPALQILGDLEVSFFMVAGLLPICAWCKKVRDDGGYWRQVEDYFAKRSQIQFTHGICLDCLQNQKEGLLKLPSE